jgi:phosphoserine phosphatase RsbU/P
MNATSFEDLFELTRIAMRLPSSHDLQMAEQVQRRLLPRSLPLESGFEFFAFYQPAGSVGGDYYDFIPLPHGRLAIALGDVAGKGLAAALMMAKFSADTRYCFQHTSAPGMAATGLNQLLDELGIDDRFITLSLGILEFEPRRFTFCSAGHPLLLIRRADGRIEERGQDINGPPLGILPDVVYQEASVDLEIGDVVLIYSDGVTDARSIHEEMYDSKTDRRLWKRLGLASGGPEATGSTIIKDIRAFSAGRSQFDDITLICFGPVGLPVANG